MSTYTVRVTRDGDYWEADIPNVSGGHTYALSFAALDQAVREVIVLGEDLDESAMAGLVLDWDLREVSELAARAVDLANKRAAAQAEVDALTERSAETARALVADHWSVRDTAAALRLSPGRISQVAGRSARASL